MHPRRLLSPVMLAIVVAVASLAGAAGAQDAPARHAATAPARVRPVATPLARVHPRRRRRVRAPRVTREPASATVAAGARVSFSASANGTPWPRVRWELSTNRGRRWRLLARARGRALSFIANLAQNGYEYRAVFANRAGRATTRRATLTVTKALTTQPAPTPPDASSPSPATPTPTPPPQTTPATSAGPSATAPAVTTQPASASVSDGATASFTAAASGSPQPTVQWQDSTDGGNSWSDIAGATATTYSFTASTSENTYLYRAVFDNSAGSALSSAAALAVASAGGPADPLVTLQPSDQTVVGGDSGSFTATASGNPAPTVQWQVSTDGGSSWSDIAGATATTYSFTADGSQEGDEYRAVFTNTGASVNSASARLTVTAEPSINWSGYSVSGNTFTSVSGAWTVPTVTSCDSGDAYSSQWVGIDGALLSSQTVEQDGTEADCVGGQAQYYAWYEMYGDTQGGGTYDCPGGTYYCAVDLSPVSYPVSPGDAMNATVSVAGTTWTLSMADTTARWTFSTTIDSPTPTPAQSSAEWIVERPELVGGDLPDLAHFTTTTFTSATASTGGGSQPISAFSNTPIEMLSENGSAVLAAPGPLSASGTSFDVNWLGSS
jgi:hypothetical protein